MNIVIDAQIVNWYRAELAEDDTPASYPPSHLIESLGETDTAFIDDGGKIEHEWRSGTDQDWFDQWFGDLLISGAIASLPVKRASKLLKKLHVDHGFPHSRDAWYVSTAKSITDKVGHPSVIVTEDMDFFDPQLKGCAAKRRQQVLASCGGSVAKYLERREGILVRSLCAHCGT